MTHFETQIRDIAHNEALGEGAKARMREQVLSYAAHKPLHHTVQGKPLRPFDYAQGKQVARSAWTAFFAQRAVATLVMFALVVGATGTAYAAEGALPGDVLYGVKTFTEQTRSVLAISNEEKIAWNIERSHRRLDEAAALAAQNELTPARDAYLAAQFEALSAAAESAIVQTEAFDAPLARALSTEFELGVAARVAVVAAAPVREGVNTKSSQPTPRIVAVAKRTAVRNKVHTENKDERPVAATAAIAAPAALSAMEAEEDIAVSAAVAPARVAAPQAFAPATSVEEIAEEALKPLERAAARQEKRLQAEASRRSAVQEVKEDAAATLDAIKEVRQELQAQQVPPNEKRAFLEAAIQEVHEARVRTLLPAAEKAQVERKNK